MPKMLKVHVTYGETKRIISLQMGSEIKNLRHIFLQVFSDVLGDQVAPANVKFQLYDNSFEEYVDLKSDERLEKDMKLLAVASKQEKQKVTPKAPEGETTLNHTPSPGPHIHWVIPWIPVHPMGATHIQATHLFPALNSSPGHQHFHPVLPNTNFRMWSIVSKQGDGLTQRDPANNNVNCRGTFNDTTGNTVITTSDINQNYVSLLFKDMAKKEEYVIKAQSDPSGNINIEAVAISPGPPYPEEATFVPHYFWSYTIFQNKWYNKKYLGCDSSGNTTLVGMSNLAYPDPQTLFILDYVQ